MDPRLNTSSVGPGPDTLNGDGGDDIIEIWGNYDKVVDGGAGNDRIHGAGISPYDGDTISSKGNHTVYGGDGDDYI